MATDYLIIRQRCRNSREARFKRASVRLRVSNNKKSSAWFSNVRLVENPLRKKPKTKMVALSELKAILSTPANFSFIEADLLKPPFNLSLPLSHSSVRVESPSYFSAARKHERLPAPPPPLRVSCKNSWSGRCFISYAWAVAPRDVCSFIVIHSYGGWVGVTDELSRVEVREQNYPSVFRAHTYEAPT